MGASAGRSKSQRDLTRDLVQEGLRLQQSERLAEAAQRYRRALDLDPACFDALQLLGVLRFRSGDPQSGIGLLQQALALQPDHAPALNNLGNALRAAGRLTEALAAYRRATMSSFAPPAVMLRNLGSALLDAGDTAQATPYLQRAALMAPDDPIAWCWLGHLERASGRPEQAVGSYERALRLDTTLAEAHRGLGSAFRDLGRYAEAAEAYARVLALDPGYLLARLLKADAELAVGSWSGWRESARAITQAAPQAGHMVEPVTVSFITDDPAVVRRYADAAAAHHSAQPAMTARAPAVAGKPAARIRVGYLSADIRDHPVGRLLAGVLEAHDRSVFDVRVFALGPPDDSSVRRRVVKAAARCEQLGGLSDESLAGTLAASQLDLLVDLMGYTAGHRARVLAGRPAPVQATWLGCPTTLGGALVDYLIADGYTVPATSEHHYAERIVRLPHAMLPGDRTRVVGTPLAREGYGLPEDAVVLCSFNQTRKLSPLLFDVWMDVLTAVPAAVLWLTQDHPDVDRNLRRAAAGRGVAPHRLVFAARLPELADHLARYLAADLALDTFPYGSHSTALDALWAGCPLVSWVGRSFASRVSGSLLRTAGLEELVAGSAEDYRELICTLARDQVRRRELRAQLAAIRQAGPLFDCAAFTRSLERAFHEMTRRARAQLPPEHLWIPC